MTDPRQTDPPSKIHDDDEEIEAALAELRHFMGRADVSPDKSTLDPNLQRAEAHLEDVVEGKNPAKQRPFVVKIETFHNDRIGGTDVEKVEDRIKERLNIPGERVSDVRISVGHRASAVFLTVSGGAFLERTIDRMVSATVGTLSSNDYSEGPVTHDRWYIKGASE